MTAELESDAQLEIGHVLFMDMLGFSKLLVDEQSECSHRLNQIVRNTKQFRVAEAADKLIRLPTGDGMVLVFYTSPEAPARCAMEIARALKDSSFGLRMGVHSGPVNKVSDVNDRSNIAGGGINMAQRVMDCGDAGHILLSKRVAEDLAQYRQWQPTLHDLGECQVKHDVTVSVVNLYPDEAGNAAVPTKFAAQRGTAAAVPTISPASARKPNSLLIAGIIIVLLAAGLGFLFFARQTSTRSASPSSIGTGPSASTALAIPEKSIAVLPFENL